MENEKEMLTLNEYQRRAMETCTESSNNFAYMALGLVAEVGEFADKVAKAVRKVRLSIDDNQLQLTDEWVQSWTPEEAEEYEKLMKGIKAELGDIMWFVSGLAEVLDIPLDDLGSANLAKLADRKKRNVIIGDGDNR